MALQNSRIQQKVTLNCKPSKASPISLFTPLSLPSVLAMELEDDVFFADLSRQIASLITEDDEADSAREELHAQYLPVPFQGYVHFPQMIMAPTYACEFSLARESRGTGVFIPKSSIPRRKTKPGIPHSTVTSYQTKQFNRKASAISQISSNNDSYYNKSGGVKKHNG